MLLRQLYEAEGKVASFALGRLNPATNGHALLVDAIKKAPGDSFLFLTDRASKLPTDPLSPDEKLDWARKSFRARHNCDNPGPRTKARYWSCRKW